ncbi:MAG: hypothetical protein ACTHZ9_03380 [Leucobacter sp.]
MPGVRKDVQEWISPVLWDWGRDNLVLVIVGFGLLTVLPIFVDGGVRRIEMKSGVRDKNTELNTAAVMLSQRTAHLATKVCDSIDGERDQRYLLHTLQECCKYFKQRGIQVDGVSPDAQVEAVLFEVILSGENSPVRLERKLQTHETKGDFAPAISRTRNRIAGELLDGLITERSPVFTATPEERGSLIEAMKGIGEDYAEYLIVPVHKDRKVESNRGIYGALMIMAEQKKTLRAMDHKLLSTFAWHCSAALSVDVASAAAEKRKVA